MYCAKALAAIQILLPQRLRCVSTSKSWCSLVSRNYDGKSLEMEGLIGKPSINDVIARGYPAEPPKHEWRVCGCVDLDSQHLVGSKISKTGPTMDSKPIQCIQIVAEVSHWVSKPSGLWLSSKQPATSSSTARIGTTSLKKYV